MAFRVPDGEVVTFPHMMSMMAIVLHGPLRSVDAKLPFRIRSDESVITAGTGREPAGPHDYSGTVGCKL